MTVATANTIARDGRKARGLCSLALAAALPFALLVTSPGLPSALAAGAEQPSAEGEHPLASVIGGQDAGPGTFPWLAKVIFQAGPGSFGGCTGTVVAPRLVLTAGHCILDEETGQLRSPSTYIAVTGNVDWTASPRQVLGVSQLLAYPGYIPTGTLAGWGDAALLVLSAPTAAPSIPLATATNAERLQAGTPAAIAGWGATFYDQEEAQTELQWAETVVQTQAYCRENAPAFFSSAQICTINPPSFATGPCHGDSGGPLIALGPGGVGLVEIGIVSSGHPKCQTTQPSIYTRTDLVSSWVARQIAALDTAPAPARRSSVPPVSRAPRLPTLTRARALRYVRTALSRRLGWRFRGKRSYRTTCRRLRATAQRCAVRWRRPPKAYRGYVTIFYAFEGTQVVWDSRISIRWSSERCYPRARQRGRCRARTAHRRG